MEIATDGRSTVERGRAGIALAERDISLPAHALHERSDRLAWRSGDGDGKAESFEIIIPMKAKGSLHFAD
jgi:hypothetical protein